MLRDGLKALPEHIAKLEGVMAITEPQIPDTDEKTAEISRRIIEICGIAQEVTVREVWMRSGISLGAFGKACIALQHAGQLVFKNQF